MTHLFVNIIFMISGHICLNLLKGCHHWCSLTVTMIESSALVEQTWVWAEVDVGQIRRKCPPIKQNTKFKGSLKSLQCLHRHLLRSISCFIYPQTLNSHPQELWRIQNKLSMSDISLMFFLIFHWYFNNNSLIFK